MNLYQLLETVDKPGRYTGGELHAANKTDAQLHFVFSYPDIYEVGMSHLGGQIIYGLLNKREDTFCKRCYAPWPDMEQAMREHQVPLFALEDKTPVKEADIWGFTLQYELSYTNILNMMDLAGISVWARERGEDCPLIVCGGPCANHAEMLADFVDVFCWGMGRELKRTGGEFLAWKKSGRG